MCFQALFRHTRPAWEPIVVDNGSTDDTVAYLDGVRDAAGVPVTIIANAENLGFPRVINQGLQAARGEYLVLLNNEAVVTDGWLDQLIALTRVQLVRVGGGLAMADANRETCGRAEAGSGDPRRKIDRTTPGGGTPAENGEFGRWSSGFSRSSDRRPALTAIGMVGPMSNYATPPQLVEDVPYRDLDQMHAFARRWRRDHRGKWSTAPKLSGFCLLMKRAVTESIGGLDERFGLGLFDDDDLAMRARRAGFELAVAHDIFVHHFGSRTFVGNGIDAEALLPENQRRFAAKWGQDGPRGRPVGLRSWSPSQPPTAMANPIEAVIGPRTARVTLTMIVRDEQDHLPPCLASISGLFDEIVVVDTGSTDRTREIAREFGARVFEFAWIDDFAAARNASLSRATGDYILWLDADDVVEPPERVKLRVLLDGLRVDEPDGYVVRCACDPSTDGSGGETVVDHVRLFPLRNDVRWTYRVHEQIMPALRRAGIPVRWTDLIVRHTGYVDLALRGRKLDRDERILLEELKGRPEDPFTLFNLGAIAIERRDWTGALGYLRRSLSRSAPSDSITRKLFALIARARLMMGDTAAALRTCAEGLSFDAQDAELLFRKGVVHRHRGESTEAEQTWRRILGWAWASTVTRPGVTWPCSPPSAAARLWAAVLGECPGDRDALAMLERLHPVVNHTAPAPC